MIKLTAGSLMKRLTMMFLVVALVPLFIVSIISFHYAKRALRYEAFDHLASVRELTRHQVLRFLENRMQDVHFLSEYPETRRSLNLLEGLVDGRGAETTSSEYESAYLDVDPLFRKHLEVYGYRDMYVISASTGRVLYSAGRGQELGTSLMNGVYKDSGLGILFRNVLKKRSHDMVDFAQYDPIGKPAAFMAAPVFNGTGGVLAVVAVQLDTEQINRIMRDNTGMGRTGERYLVGPDLLMRSDSRFQNETSVLKQGIDTAATRDLLAHGEGRRVIKNHRGERVLSCYSPAALDKDLGTDFDWGIVVEMSQAEAFAPVQGLRLQIILVGIILAMLACLAGIYAARSIAQPLMGATNSLAASIAQISSTVTRLVNITEDTSSSISEITTTVEEVKQTAHVSNEKAEQVAEASMQVAQISDAGKKATEDAFSGMNNIREEMESIAESIVRLSEQIQSIEEIINTVNDLADQSNLLSVNASIEAARAGEHGRSFAVVAQEVKNLADQSMKATEQVRNILNDIQKATGEAVMSTERGNTAVEEGANLAALAGDAIQKLADSITRSAQSATQIAASSKQQLIGTDQLAAAMEIIKEGSIQNMNGTRELEGATRSIEDLMHTMRELAGASSNRPSRNEGRHE
ncbi:MAG: methyl-accepting chemotaxis protein [bacterium]